MPFRFFQLITLLVLFSAASFARAQELPTSQDYMQSAQSALQDNDISRAIEDYYLAIKLNPQNWEAYQNLGGCYVQLHKMNEAKAAYQQSLAINPNNPDLIKFMGQIWQLNPSPTPTANIELSLPVINIPTPTPTFVGVYHAPTYATPTATPTFVGILMNTPTSTATPFATPAKVEVMVPFIEFTTPIVSQNGQVSAAIPYRGFKPYVYQALARYNLPDKDSLTLDIGGAVWFGSAQNVNDYFGSSLTPTVSSSTSGELNVGVDYALLNEFQLGVHVEGLVDPPAKSTLGNEGVEWDSYSMGGALSGKYLIPLNSAMSLVLHVEGGYYTLVASDIKYDNGAGGNIGLGGSAFGGLGEVQLELFQVEDKSMALDFGLGYRALTFNNLTGSGTKNGAVVSGPLPNANGTPAYVDFSGPRVSISIRFVH